MSDQKQKTILLVEDEGLIALSFAATIERFGYNVLTANSGEQAVKIALENGEPDLILMDIDLGKGIDGTEAAKHILQQRTVPIVFLTSHGEREMVELVRGITRYGYVIKHSGDFVLQSSIEMAFELFDAKQKAESQMVALQKSEDKFCKAFRASPAAIVVSSMEDGRYIEVNDVFLRITGLLRDEVIGHTSTELGFWVELDARQRYVESLARNGSSRNFEIGYRMRSGEVREFLVSGEIIELEGEPCSLNFILDITERKAADAELRLQSLVLDQIAECVTVTDLQGNIRYVNAAECKTVRRDRKDLLGRHISVFGEDPQRGATQQEFIDNTLARGEWRAEVVNYASDGSQNILDCHTRLVRDERGEAIAMVGTAIDVTEGKKTENRLLTLSAAIEHSPVSVVITNREPLIEYVNPQFELVTGFRAAEVIGRNPRILQSGDTPHETYEHMWGTLMAGKIWHGEFRNKRRDGSLFWEESWISPIIGPDGNIAQFVGLKEDITERKEIARSLEEHREALRRFAAHLEAARENERTAVAREVHDAFGQILAAIKLEASALMNPDDQDPEYVTSHVSSIFGLVKSGLKSVKEISGRLRPAILDNLGLVSALEWQAEEFERHSGIRCEVSLPAGDITIDIEKATALFRISQALLTNVILHSRARKVHLQLTEQPEGLELTISDDGIGITEDEINSPQSFGLIGIRERVRNVRGSFSLQRSETGGTVARAYIPSALEERP